MPARRGSGLYAGEKVPSDVAALIDHTLLKADATRQEIEKLCKEAREFGFATVCVNPTWVSLCARLLRGSSTGVCTVVGFPLGATTTDVKQYETRRVIYDGASEVDMVINVGALKSGDLGVVERDIAAVVSACKGLRRAEQGHHRSGAADRRGKNLGVRAVQGCRCRLREDVDWIRARRRDGGRCRADAARRGAGHRREGRRRRARLRSR